MDFIIKIMFKLGITLIMLGCFGKVWEKTLNTFERRDSWWKRIMYCAVLSVILASAYGLWRYV